VRSSKAHKSPKKEAIPQTGRLASQYDSSVMAPRTKGKWAQGIQPRNFSWIIKDQLAVCERPGGYGSNHRRVRRQEEIIWIREQGFGCIVSLIAAPHNLHNYEELGVPYIHRPFSQTDDALVSLGHLYPEMNNMLRNGTKLIVHSEEVGDKVAGVMGGYIRWAKLVTDEPKCTTTIETILSRQLDPFGRSLIGVAAALRPA
jgi:hypothetical protein